MLLSHQHRDQSLRSGKRIKRIAQLFLPLLQKHDAGRCKYGWNFFLIRAEVKNLALLSFTKLLGQIYNKIKNKERQQSSKFRFF